jgi:hypothetical protein
MDTKIIQIETTILTYADQSTRPALIALCEDGTLWFKSSIFGNMWRKIDTDAFERCYENDKK